jgi:hypothetical protein
MRPAVLPLALFALAPAGAALADACETVKDAYDRMAAAPALDQTMRMEGMPEMRMITAEGKIFMNAGDGTWQTMPLDPAMRAEMMASIVPDAAALTGCAELGPETLDGVAMTVFEYTPPAFGGVQGGPQKVWIGDEDGLPHRMTAVEEGMSMEMTVVYEGVVPPTP